MVYAEKERPKDVIALRKSVKAQVHSLETRGRHHRVISTEPPTQTANAGPTASGMVNNNKQPTFTKNNNPSAAPAGLRSRSENPPKSRGNGHLRNSNGTSSKQPMSLAPTLEDDFASRVNPDNKNANKKMPPPPMPEKTKIHLKNDSKGTGFLTV